MTGVLACRVIDPPHAIPQRETRRMREAMLVSYSAMSLGDLKAVDKVIKVARELDRYHGFAPDRSAPSYAPSFPAAPLPPLALPEPVAANPTMDWDESELRDARAEKDGIQTVHPHSSALDVTID